MCDALFKTFLYHFSQPSRSISWALHKFHGFQTLFAFYTIKKHFKYTSITIFHEQNVRNFKYFHGYDLKKVSITWISFFDELYPIILRTCSSNLIYTKKFHQQKKFFKISQNIDMITWLECRVQNNALMEGKLQGGSKSYFSKNICRASAKNARQRYMFAVRLEQTHGKLCVFAVHFRIAHGKG
jgi:hypothetical protein